MSTGRRAVCSSAVDIWVISNFWPSQITFLGPSMYKSLTPSFLLGRHQERRCWAGVIVWSTPYSVLSNLNFIEIGYWVHYCVLLLFNNESLKCIRGPDGSSVFVTKQQSTVWLYHNISILYVLQTLCSLPQKPSWILTLQIIFGKLGSFILTLARNEHRISVT